MLKKRNRRIITLIVCFLVLAIVSTIYINQYKNVEYQKTAPSVDYWRALKSSSVLIFSSAAVTLATASAT